MDPQRDRPLPMTQEQLAAVDRVVDLARTAPAQLVRLLALRLSARELEALGDVLREAAKRQA